MPVYMKVAIHFIKRAHRRGLVDIEEDKDKALSPSKLSGKVSVGDNSCSAKV